jgi:hypothetical protein
MNSLYAKFKNLNENELNVALFTSCRCGNLEEVKYLLTSSELDFHANPQSYSHAGFNLACSEGHLEVVQYLLTSPELKLHANIHANEHDYVHTPFVHAVKQPHVLYYFILELNIERKIYIDEYLHYFPNENIVSLFEIRELNKNKDKEHSSKRKIKL